MVRRGVLRRGVLRAVVLRVCFAPLVAQDGLGLLPCGVDHHQLLHLRDVDVLNVFRVLHATPRWNVSSDKERERETRPDPHAGRCILWRDRGGTLRPGCSRAGRGTCAPTPARGSGSWRAEMRSGEVVVGGVGVSSWMHDTTWSTHVPALCSCFVSRWGGRDCCTRRTQREPGCVKRQE